MRALNYLSAGMLLAASMAGAQTAADHIALGDKEYVAMNAGAALQHYAEALKLDSTNYEALWKASRSDVDLGSYEANEEKRGIYYRNAELYARRAVAANSGDAEGHFNLARALGKNALSQGPKARIKYAKEVRTEALACLKIDPKQAGCLHVMGMWNAEVMRLGGFTRMMAKNFLGGQIFGSASWPEAKRYMEESVAAEPNRIIHHLDLGGVYRDLKDNTKARAQYEAVMKLPNADYNDRHFKAEADAALRAG
jgi:hypothetical protein